MSTDLHPIFDAVKAEESTRYEINKVFVKSGYRYATNGGMIVRQPCDEPDTAGKFPSTSGLGWARDLYSATATPIPQLPQSEHEPCDDCGGKGIVHCDYNYKHECKECLGAGAVIKYIPVKVGDRLFSNRFLMRILPYTSEVFLSLNAGLGPCYFVITADIDGLLMRIHKTQ